MIPCSIHLVSRKSLLELLEEEPELAAKLVVRDAWLRQSSSLTQQQKSASDDAS